jgi:acyl phosphate:glycerol-3-phosphate acyltransferase
MNLLLQLAAIALGYAFGIIPTARLITRFAANKDVLEEGSQKAGAMNAYRVSGKPWVGAAVAFVDIAKGFLAVKTVWLLGVGEFTLFALAGFFCVFGHCYNVIYGTKQGLRGGRGLAPAAGVALAINPVMFVVFCLMWLTGYFVIRRDVHVGTMVAALGTFILIFNTPDLLLKTFMQVPCEPVSQLTVFTTLLCVLIAVRHVEPIRELLGGPGRDGTGDAEEN